MLKLAGILKPNNYCIFIDFLSQLTSAVIATPLQQYINGGFTNISTVTDMLF